jgi:hypothetical protein
LDGLEDVLITGATTSVSCYAFPDLLFTGLGVFEQKLYSAHQKAGSTVAALQAVTIAERLLYGMKLTIDPQSFDCQHLSAIRLEGEQRARLHGSSVEHHSTRAAIAGVAPDVRTGEIQFFT